MRLRCKANAMTLSAASTENQLSSTRLVIPATDPSTIYQAVRAKDATLLCQRKCDTTTQAERLVQNESNADIYIWFACETLRDGGFIRGTLMLWCL